MKFALCDDLDYIWRSLIIVALIGAHNVLGIIYPTERENTIAQRGLIQNASMILEVFFFSVSVLLNLSKPLGYGRHPTPNSRINYNYRIENP